MEQTLNALGGILLRGIPTLLLVMFLYFYLKKVFFAPLEKLLETRRAATEGARAAAEASFARADEMAAQYEQAIRQARAEIYSEQEKMRRDWREEQNARMREARAEAGRQVERAREQLDLDVADSRERLAAESEALADRITERILAGSVQ